MSALPRPLPRGIVAPFLVVSLLLWLLAANILLDDALVAVAGVAGALLLGTGAVIENMALARRRAHVYRDLGIPIPLDMARSVCWDKRQLYRPSVALTLVMAAFFVLAEINSVWPLPGWFALGWLLLCLAGIFVGGPLWLRRLQARRTAAMKDFSARQVLKLDVKRRFGDQSQFSLWGKVDGREVQVQTNGHLRVAVLVEEYPGDFLRIVTASWRDRWAIRRAGPVIKTSDAAFDRRFLAQSAPSGRGSPFFEDADLRRRLLLHRELGALYLVIGGNGLLLTQDYRSADGEYLGVMLSLAVDLAKRWDGQETVAFPVSA